MAGGKGASLSRMARAGLPVPPGFVIAAGAFQGFLEACGGIDLIARLTNDLDVNDSSAVERTADDIRGLIVSTPLLRRWHRRSGPRTPISRTASSWPSDRALSRRTAPRRVLPASRTHT